jgi:hypothetical protein
LLMGELVLAADVFASHVAEPLVPPDELKLPFGPATPPLWAVPLWAAPVFCAVGLVLVWGAPPFAAAPLLPAVLPELLAADVDSEHPGPPCELELTPLPLAVGPFGPGHVACAIAVLGAHAAIRSPKPARAVADAFLPVFELQRMVIPFR